ncbi:SDR family NAD(P)-dependent oxidoreductase [Streptomyces sp. CA-181903]|uniref:SDR family NAD(P)-dependent oxidoreductase n=1 Tax=Streptomyces sp. CA-181903 TaxID=3240055 RepID=UPI003D8EADF0
MLDAAFQAGAPLLRDRATTGAPYLPCGLSGIRVWRAPGPSGLVHVRERGAVEPEVCWDITVMDEDGTVAVEVERFRLRRMPDGRTPLSVQRTVLRAAPRAHDGDDAPHLPPAVDIVAATAPRAETLAAVWREAGHDRAVRERRDIIARCSTAVLAGFLADPADPFTVPDLVEAGLLPQHRRLVRTTLPLLEEQGLARSHPDGRWQLLTAPGPLAEPLRELLAGHPAGSVENGLVARHLHHMPGILRGTDDPVELLSSDTVRFRQFYELGAHSRFTNVLTRILLEEIVRLRPAGRPLRILEIGAGTGGLTATVLPVLPADRTHYTFTDVSTSFLTPAEHRFTDYDFVEYRTFDLNAPAAEQGLPENAFDVVLAANALHTAADLATALHHVRRLLAPDGRLLAAEAHDTLMLATVFGTLDTFWNRSDRELRPDCVLLDREQWPPLLRRCGFTDVARAGGEEGPWHSAFSVLVAAADGRTAVPPALPEPAPDTVWTIAAEDPSEEQPARDLAALLGDATVTTLDAVGDVLPRNAHTAVTVLLFAEPEEDPERVVARTTRRAAALRSLVAARDRLPGATQTRTWLVTRPTGLLPAPERPAHPGDAPVWGAARVLANERPDLNIRRISLDRGDDASADALRLAHELLGPDDEDEIVLTREGRFVPRETEHPASEPPTPDRPAPAPDSAPLDPPSAASASGPTDGFVLSVRDPGLSYRFVWTRHPLPRPGPGQVTVAVEAVGLNYRDTLQANGLLPSEVVEGTPSEHGLGLECSGTVTATGPGVTTWAPGDRVFGLCASALASHVVVDARALMRIPDGMGFTDAATLPVVFGTVHYSLSHLARLAPGETVLVHGGAGGIGLATLQYARLTGAEVIATAGSEAKRDLVAALGADHVLDSRTLDFVPRVRELTGGRGVDVVVNSLSGQAIAHSLELLRPGGRFIELGKRDMLEDKHLPQRPFLRNLAYFGVDLAGLTADPRSSRPHVAEIARRIRAGDYRPLPHVAYPAARVHEAFRLLQHSRHTGKVVVRFDPSDEPVPVRPTLVPPALDPEGTYLVTGGLGGFGAATAAWLTDLGARHLALVSRRGETAPEAAAVLDRLARRGATATPYAADVTDEAAVREVIAAVDATGHPLRGVAHCAMHLDDAAFTDLTDERFAAVLSVKAAGAAVLHQLTADRELDLFLLHSSMSARVGNPHQAAYAAGNSYLEALARARRHTGRPAAAVAWGAIAETGYVARNDLHETLAAVGMEPVAPGLALQAASNALAAGMDVAGISTFTWSRARRVLPTLSAPRFSLVMPAHADVLDDRREETLRALAGMPPDEAVRAITDLLGHQLAAILRTDPAELTPDRQLTEVGIDSLMVAEFLVRSREYFDIHLTPAELLNSGGTLTHIARLVHQRLTARGG